MTYKEMYKYKMEMRTAICQYCIDHGIEIHNNCFGQNAFMTTDKEVESACSPDRPVRYVAITAIEEFERNPRQYQIREAIRRDYNAIDWRNWQRLQEILGLEISSVTAKRISNILADDKQQEPRHVAMNHEKDIRGRTRRYLDMLPQKTRDKITKELSGIGIDIEKVIAEREKRLPQSRQSIPLPEIPELRTSDIE